MFWTSMTSETSKILHFRNRTSNCSNSSRVLELSRTLLLKNRTEQPWFVPYPQTPPWHKHMHTHTHTQAKIQTRTYIRKHSPTYPKTQTQTFTPTLTQTKAHAHTRAHTHTYTSYRCKCATCSSPQCTKNWNQGHPEQCTKCWIQGHRDAHVHEAMVPTAMNWTNNASNRSETRQTKHFTCLHDKPNISPA